MLQTLSYNSNSAGNISTHLQTGNAASTVDQWRNSLFFFFFFFFSFFFGGGGYKGGGRPSSGGRQEDGV